MPTPTDWPSGPFPPELDKSPLTAFGVGVTAEKVDMVVKCAFTCQSASDIAIGIALGIASAGLSAGISIAEQVLSVTGVGATLNIARHGAAAASTYDHMEAIAAINYGKCTCDYCDAVAGYVLNKKLHKFGRRVSKTIPGIGLLTTIGEKIKGIYKFAKGTRGVNRMKNAATVWIAAKEGCPTAKAMVNELFSNKPSKLMLACANYVGVIAIANKMKST